MAPTCIGAEPESAANDIRSSALIRSIRWGGILGVWGVRAITVTVAVGPAPH